MAYQIVAVNDAAPGACVDVGLTWNGSDTLTSTEAYSGTSITLSGTFTGGASTDIALNTDKFTVDATNGNTLIAGTCEITGALTQTGAASLASTLAVTGNSTHSAAMIMSGAEVAATSGAVVVPITNVYSGYTTNSTAAIAASLADGAVGQIKIVKLTTKDTNNMVLTPANLTGGTTITFDATGEVAILMFIGTAWTVIYTNATVA